MPKIEKKASEDIIVEPNKKWLDPKKFTGIMHGCVYNPHPQGFANFSVTTVTVEAGEIKSIELSDYYNANEIKARLSIANDRLADRMRANYPAGYRHV